MLRTFKTTIQKNLPKSQKFARRISVSEFRYSQDIPSQFRVISFHSILDEKVTSNRQKVTNNKRKITSNEQKVRSNEEKITSNGQKVTSNNQKITSNEQKVTTNEKTVTSNKQKVTSNEQQAKSLTSNYLFLSFDLIMIAFYNFLCIKGSSFAQTYFVVNGAREFNIR